MVGPVYFDLVFSGFSSLPALGREVRTTALASSPGGIANVAVALSRLGLPVALVSVFATDAFGQYLWSTLEQENIDLSRSHKCASWTTPVTVSMSYDADRSLVTHEVPAPVSPGALLEAAAGSRSVIVDLETCSIAELESLRDENILVVADVCWDATETWASDVLDKLAMVDLFLPNSVEAIAYTGASDPTEALVMLAARTPGTVVVKDGIRGASASEDGVTASAPSIGVTAIDPTGAGDVFDAAFIYGTLAAWTLDERLRFANLCAGLSVQRHGGSLAAPCWEEVRTYCRAGRAMAEWAFLQSTLASEPSGRPCTRACPTFSLPEIETGAPGLLGGIPAGIGPLGAGR
ncbi:MAG: carbohydrate kinase family protein [Acidimicrobiales bacterium]